MSFKPYFKTIFLIFRPKNNKNIKIALLRFLFICPGFWGFLNLKSVNLEFWGNPLFIRLLLPDNNVDIGKEVCSFWSLCKEATYI